MNYNINNNISTLQKTNIQKEIEIISIPDSSDENQKNDDTVSIRRRGRPRKSRIVSSDSDVIIVQEKKKLTNDVSILRNGKQRRPISNNDDNGNDKKNSDRNIKNLNKKRKGRNNQSNVSDSLLDNSVRVLRNGKLLQHKECSDKNDNVTKENGKPSEKTLNQVILKENIIMVSEDNLKGEKNSIGNDTNIESKELSSFTQSFSFKNEFVDSSNKSESRSNVINENSALSDLEILCQSLGIINSVNNSLHDEEDIGRTIIEKNLPTINETIQPKKSKTIKRKRKSEAFNLEADFVADYVITHKRIELLTEYENLQVYGLDTVAFKIRWKNDSSNYDSWKPLILACKLECVASYIRKFLIPMIGYVKSFNNEKEEIISFEFIEPSFISGNASYYLNDLIKDINEFDDNLEITSELKEKTEKRNEEKKRRKRGPPRYRKFRPSRDGLDAFDIPLEASDDDALYQDSEFNYFEPINYNYFNDDLNTIDSLFNDFQLQPETSNEFDDFLSIPINEFENDELLSSVFEDEPFNVFSCDDNLYW